MYSVNVSARILKLPQLCCCCGVSEPQGRYQACYTRTTGKRVVRTDTRSWSFPICGPCISWIELDSTANRNRAVFVGTLVVGILGIFLGFSSNEGKLFLVAGILSLILSIFAFKVWSDSRIRATEAKPSESCDARPVQFLGWNGSVQMFGFSNRVFCGSFQSLNSAKLVEF